MCFQPFKDKQKLSGEKEKREVGKEIFKTDIIDNISKYYYVWCESDLRPKVVKNHE
jgi:hypothetical protein